jgi:repressor LexA
LLAEENLQGYVRIPSSAAKGAEHFFLRVRGDSMDQAEVDGKRIESGDMVLVRRQQTAEHGDIVIALVDGQATVKEFAVGEGYYVLRPRSSKADYEPILVEDDFQIQGIVKRVYKGGTRFLLESVSD